MAAAPPRVEVVIDPGHGGSAPRGRSTPIGVEPVPGIVEKAINLELAARVARQLGPLATLTRGDDVNLSLRERTDAAQRSGARALVSIHANAGVGDASGSEVWLHERHGADSERLARAIHANLERSGPARGVFRGPLALLDPDAVGGAAACLIEADYLSSAAGRARLTDPQQLDVLATAIAAGIRSYLDGGGSAVAQRSYGAGRGRRPAWGDGWFTDADELTASMRDQRAGDTLRVSAIADGEAIVDAYVARGAPTVWSGIDPNAAAAEIRDRCSEYRLIDQGNLNLCGPAALMSMWAGRDPVGYAEYAVGLLETGTGHLGSNTVTASASMRRLVYPRLGNPNATMSTPAADFVALAALRNDANAILPYDGRRSMEQLAGLTTPEELAGWMRDTGIWTSVRNEANWARTRGYDHAMSLLPGVGTDIAVLINVNALANAGRVESIAGSQVANPVAPDRAFILNQFPNHFVVLLSEIVPDASARTVSLSAWTWGGSYVFADIPVRDFTHNYYGAVIGRVRR